MGTCTFVEGVKRSTDPNWQKMKHVYDACVSAGIDIPEEVDKFFNHQEPHDLGTFVNLEDFEGVKKIWEEYRDGYEIELERLPEDIKVIRIYVSY